MPKPKTQSFAQPAIVPQISRIVPCQQVHFFAPNSSAENGYDPGITRLIKYGKRIVAMQLTREHLVVITEN